jgi:hypothetical protein
MWGAPLISNPLKEREVIEMNKEIKMMVKSLLRGIILAILTMNLVGNFEISTLGWSMVLYAVAMKSSNVILNQLREFDNA